MRRVLWAVLGWMFVAHAAWAAPAAPTRLEPDPQTHAEYVRVADLVTFPWGLDREIHGGGDDPIDESVKLFDMTLTTPELASARRAYLAVALAQMVGFKLRERGGLSLLDVMDLAEVLRAAITKRYELLIGPLVGMVVGPVVDKVKHRVGTEIFGKGIELHSEMWAAHLVPVARRVSGPAVSQAPLEVAVSRGTEPQTGLALVNRSGRELRHVTVRVDSGLGTRAEGNMAPYYIFRRRWPANEEILLAPMTVISVLRGKPMSAFSPRVVYSVWSDELSAEDVLATLPAANHEQARTAGPGIVRYRLPLTLDRALGGAPPPRRAEPPVLGRIVPNVVIDRGAGQKWEERLEKALREGNAEAVLQIGPVARAEWAKDGAKLSGLAWRIVAPEAPCAVKLKAEPRLLALATELSERALDVSNWKDADAAQALARCHWLAGAKVMAIEMQRLAVESAEEGARPRYQKQLREFEKGGR